MKNVLQNLILTFFFLFSCFSVIFAQEKHYDFPTWGDFYEQLWNENEGVWKNKLKIQLNATDSQFIEFMAFNESGFENDRSDFFKGLESQKIPFSAPELYFSTLTAKYINLFEQYKKIKSTNPIQITTTIASKTENPFDSRGTRGTCNPGCTNIGFQDKTLSYWDSYKGVQSSSSASTTPNITFITGGPSGAVTQDGQISLNLNPGNDPVVGPLIPLTPPLGGISAMVGDGPVPGKGVGILEQTFKVNASNPILTLQYAIVLQNPGHTGFQQPFFRIELFDQNNNPIPGCGQFSIISSGTGFQTVNPIGGGDAVSCRPWSTAFIQLNNYIGQCVTLRFVTGDCSLGGHFGYAYVAASCTKVKLLASTNKFCAGQTSATISGPPGASKYTWSTVDGKYSGSLTGPTLTITSGGTYKLITETNPGPQCTGTEEFSITIPQSTDGPPPTPCFTATTACAKQPTTFNASCSNPGTGGKFLWDFFNSGSYQDSSGANPQWTFTAGGTYRVRLRRVAANGCEAESFVNVTVVPSDPPSIPTVTVNAINATSCSTCNGNLSFSVRSTNASTTPVVITNTCNSFVINYTPGAGNGGVTYSGNISGLGISSICINNQCTYSVSLTPSPATICPQNCDVFVKPSTPIPPTPPCNPQGYNGDTISVPVGVNGVTIAVNQDVSPATCNKNNGSVKVAATGGVQPYTYTWTGGLSGTNPTNLAGGEYSLTVKDASGCSTKEKVVIPKLDAIGVTAIPFFANCSGQNDGKIKLKVLGGATPYTYNWTPNVSASDSATSLAPGNYSVKVTDATGCSGNASTTIKTPSNLNVNFSGTFTNLPCNSTGTVTANASGGLPPYTFDWSSGQKTQTISGLTSGLYSVTVTDAAGCQVVNSANVTFLSNLSLSVSPDSVICSGESVTLTGSGGSGYNWSTGETSSSITVKPSQTTTYSVTSTGACGNVTLYKKITVTSAGVASLNISASATSFCPGTAVTFTATSTNGGNSPSYQWKVNGANAGSNSPTFIISSLNDNDQVTAVMTASGNCSTGSPATSNAIKVSVNTSAAASVSISASKPSICAGESISFTATPVNGGTTPGYQWKVNGSNVNGSGNIYTASNLSNNDKVTAVMTSSASCVSGSPATSNEVSVVVNSPLPASVTINASQTSICSGENISFTALPTNGGTTPAYQWRVNGSNVGGNSNSFSSATLKDNDVVSVVMTSNGTCISGSPATSNTIAIKVNATSTPSVSIVASKQGICSGETVTFTASPVSGGTAPVYQWKVNGTNVGSDTPTFTTTSLKDNEQVSVVMTSNSSCATTPNATSNVVSISVTNPGPASVTISAPSTSICAGGQVTFTANPANGGATPSYQWKLNGQDIGTNSNTFSSSTLADGNTISCVMTSSSSCVTGSPATSNAITLKVYPNDPPSITVTTPSLVVCQGKAVTFTAQFTNGGSNPVLQWKVNGIDAGTNNPSFTTTNLSNGDDVTCQVKSDVGCLLNPFAISDPILMTVISDLGIITALRDTVCSGSPATLQLSGNFAEIQWQSSANLPVFANIDGAVNAKLTKDLTQKTWFRVIRTNKSCPDTTDSYLINTNSAPVADFTFSKGGNTVSFKNNSSPDGLTYSWDFGDKNATSTQSNPSYPYSQNGSYKVCLTAKNKSGCTDVKCKIVDIATAIDFIDSESNWIIFPNPVNDKLMIQSKGINTNPAELTILDLAGRVVLKPEVFLVQQNNFTVDMSPLTKGTYFLMFEAGDRHYMKRLVKN